MKYGVFLVNKLMDISSEDGEGGGGGGFHEQTFTVQYLLIPKRKPKYKINTFSNGILATHSLLDFLC